MRLLITLMMYCCFVAAGWAQPSNDECTNLIELGYAPYCSDPGQYTNVGATPSVISTLPADNIPTCMTSAPLRDVWFSFKAPDDGNLLDVQLSVLGNIGGNGTMRMPTVTVYRGDCTIDELNEFFCAAAPLNVNEASVNVLGMSPGATYYVRVTDYSATAGSNAGTFKLCIEPFVNEYVMGQTTSAASCTGILYDSGGSGGNYGNNQTLEFNICPQEFHQCILLTVENYDIENALGFGTGDFLRVYAGPNASSGLEITQLSGMGGPLTIPINTPCATVLFDSDPTMTLPGFTITWECTTATCPDNPVVSCQDPVIVDLPFTSNNLSNCISGNTISSTPCTDDSYLQGNDYVFSYTSQGDECIRVITSNTNIGAGLGVYLNCPTDPNAQCITSSGGEFVSDPVVNAAFLESPGTYYIVFGSFGQCSNFNISIDTVTCPVVLPSASTCDQSLNIAGCENTIPQIIALNPGDGDPNFITEDNNGCIATPSAGFNFSFFYFQAQSDGKFGFIVESADQAEATDIDFNVWGPIPSVADICDFVTNNEPIRSSWEAWFGFEDDWTGLTDVNPEDGTAVTDDFDCGSPATPNAGGDGFVRRIDVQQGEIYVVMLDDYDGVIETGGIAIDFSGTTTGVLGGAGDEVTVTADTAVCSGQFVQLNATGGEAYFWADSDNLSCTQCPNPLAIITENSTFQVNIVTACATITRTVNVKLLDLDLGPDIVVCNGAEFQLNENADPNDGQYAWIGPPGLSCIDCPSPTVSGLATGIYTYQAVLITPQCTVYDTIVITVLNGTQPQYNIAKDTILCAGETINLGGAAIAGNTYFWSPIASPQDTIANPSVTPTQSTTYYISVNNGICPVPAVDSVVVQVFQAPVLNVIADQSICQGDTLQLGNTVIEDGVTYTWTPNVGVFEADNPNSLATPTAPTTIYTLTATNPGCEVNESVTISATQIDLMLSVGDTVLCKGNSLNINATVFPVGTNVSWNNISTLQIQPGGLSVIATPLEDVLYTATVQVPGCMRHQSFYVK
ncbi:MAG: hypothetical protein IT269_00885, partial [Saprospiraceae bacterium]|nr:hypothetical protein [Saprospiraceae bacterium]